MPGKHHLRVFKIAKKIGSPLRGSWICDMCIAIDARKTSLTGVQNSKKNRLAATRLVDDAPPWKKARSAAGMWGKNLFFFVMLLPRGKILISSAKYWFLGMRILKSSNTTWQLWSKQSLGGGASHWSQTMPAPLPKPLSLQSVPAPPATRLLNAVKYTVGG